MECGGVQEVYRMKNENALICAYSVLCMEAYKQQVDAELEKVTQYQHDASV